MIKLKKKGYLKYLRGIFLKRRFYCKVTFEQCVFKYFNKFILFQVFWYFLGEESLLVESNDFGFFNCFKNFDNVIKIYVFFVEKFRSEIINTFRRYVDCCIVVENIFFVI